MLGGSVQGECAWLLTRNEAGSIPAPPAKKMPNHQLLLGDCLSVLKTIPDNSVDSLITDPPAGISFMGKEWDSAKGGRKEWVEWMASVMRECLRVMKPGAHGLVWAIPRTSHWTATALEDAGFEVRDVITHLFGQGFPKSLDISKAIDKAAGAEREIIGPSARHGGGTKNCYGDGMGDEAKTVLTAPATDAAKQWSGWGTALKPASEHWILVRKPCAEKTVAANVLEWGTGGINIDASRIESAEKLARPFNQAKNQILGKFSHFGNPNEPQGRFPANLVLSHSPYCTDDQCDIECAIEHLDGQSGVALPKKNRVGKRGDKGFGMFDDAKSANLNGVWPADPGGGASRFFYCAKISTSERGQENNHPTVKPQKLMRYFCRLITPPDGVVLDPFMGSGSTGMAAKSEEFNFIGIEQDKNYFEIAHKRIHDLSP